MHLRQNGYGVGHGFLYMVFRIPRLDLDLDLDLFLIKLDLGGSWGHKRAQNLKMFKNT
jgi:hypothetical protein